MFNRSIILYLYKIHRPSYIGANITFDSIYSLRPYYKTTTGNMAMKTILRYLVPGLIFGLIFIITCSIAGLTFLHWWQVVVLIIGTGIANDTYNYIKGKMP